MGTELVAFVESWVDLAEWTRAEKDWPPDECLRQTLEVVEADRGRVSANMLFQILLVVINHWVHGDEAYAGLSPLERRGLDDYVLLALQAAQQDAQEPADGSP
jgi:hypothetical protein